MSYAGSWNINDVVTLVLATQSPQTGQAMVADAAPTYRVYENITGTPLVTGAFAALDAVNVTGFYVAQITLTAAAGFEVTKHYTITKQAVVGGITGVELDQFQIQAGVTATTVSDKTGYGLSSGERTTLIAALLDLANGIETGLTPREALKFISSMVFGIASGLETAAPVFKSADFSGNSMVGTVSRVTFASADTNGNRPTVTVNRT
jgi:hypothetical protein